MDTIADNPPESEATSASNAVLTIDALRGGQLASIANDKMESLEKAAEANGTEGLNVAELNGERVGMLDDSLLSLGALAAIGEDFVDPFLGCVGELTNLCHLSRR